MGGRGFFSRMIGGEGGEDETRIYSADELETSKRPPESQEFKEEHQQAHGFTAERAAEIIDDLPPEVPRESALRIVRGPLEAAGVRGEEPGGPRRRGPGGARGGGGGGRGPRGVSPRAGGEA